MEKQSWPQKLRRKVVENKMDSIREIWYEWKKTLVEELNSLMSNVVIQGLGEDCWC